MPSVIIVTGALFVSPEERAAYLEDCRAVVQQARTTPGCLDFALSADLLDDRRINVLERWASDEDLAQFRGAGPSEDQMGKIEATDVREFRVDSA